MRGHIRCVDGRLMRHDPQHDDPDLETDRGQCEQCEGFGCDTIDALIEAMEDAYDNGDGRLVPYQVRGALFKHKIVVRMK
jgi:hypothetical protein